MYEVRFHGRGGQGAVTAANILAAAAFKEGKQVQAFPMFGVERRGAPVAAFTRMDDRRIDLRTQVYTPDCVVVLDTTLLNVVDVGSGIKDGGTVILNTQKNPSDFKYKAKVFCVDATTIAVNNRLGTATNPIVNTAILGAFSKATDKVGMGAIEWAIEKNAPVKTAENRKAAKDAFEKTRGP